jgi:hypothetical protein
VRLEYRDHALPRTAACGVDGRGDLAGQVCIVVDIAHTRAFAAVLKTAGDAAESGECARHGVELDAELERDRGGAGRVRRGFDSERHRDRAARFTVDREREAATGRGRFFIDDAVVRARRDAERAHARMRGNQRRRHRIVGRHHERARDCVGELAERANEPVEVAVMIEVIGFDVRHERRFGREVQERAVALVGLDDEPLAIAVRGVGADFVDLAADDEARMPAGPPQDQREHRRARRLPVRSRDRDGSPGRRERGKRRRPVQHRDVVRLAVRSSMFDRGTAVE